MSIPNEPESPTKRRLPNGSPKSGCRVVHIVFPEKVFNHAKAQAFLSGIPWTHFVERLLAESTVIAKE